MSSMIRQLAQRSSQHIVKGSTPEAWETTAKLRSQFVTTSMDALPARMAHAGKEWAELRAKIGNRDFTLNEIARGTVRVAELYAFYFAGKCMGARTIPA